MEFTDGKLVHVLLAHELRRSVDRAFGTSSCSHQGQQGLLVPDNSFGPPPGNPYGAPPGNPYAPGGPGSAPPPPRPPRDRRGLIMRLSGLGRARLHLPDVLRELRGPLDQGAPAGAVPELRRLLRGVQLLRRLRRGLLLLRGLLRLRLLTPARPTSAAGPTSAHLTLPRHTSAHFSSGGEISETSMPDSVVPHFLRMRS